MTTSANVIEYRIEKDGAAVGNHHYNIMCKSHFEELLKFQPLEEHTITPYGYDEEEDYWEDESENLNDFLMHLVHSNKEIREYYVNEELKKNGRM